MNPTLAVVLPVTAFAVVGVIGLWFMAAETRRFHDEHGELERRHRDAIYRADEVLKQPRIDDRKVN